MDSITQFALGAAVGELTLGKKIGNKAIVLGGMIATIPDLDIVLNPFYSELEKISLHRGFSHSILFCILGTFLFSYLLKRTDWLKDIPIQKILTFVFLSLSTHIALDCFTPYGTQILFPFSDLRVSLDSISIIDPVYTIPILTGLYLNATKRKSSSRINYTALTLTISTCYLLFTLFNKEIIISKFNARLNAEKISYNKLLTVPVSAGNIKWYGVARTDDSLYIGNYSYLNKDSILFESFPINEQLLLGLDSVLVDRMVWFSKGFYTVLENEGRIRLYNMQCDMQGVRKFGNYKAPTAFYYEIELFEDGKYSLRSDMHKKDASPVKN